MFDGSEPLDTPALLRRLSTASDEMNVSVGEVPYLLAYQRGCDAKETFVRETSGSYGSAVCFSFPHTFNYLWTHYASEDALSSAEMALRRAGKHRDGGKTALHDQRVRLGRQLMSMYDPEQLRYLYPKGLDSSVQGQAELDDRTCSCWTSSYASHRR